MPFCGYTPIRNLKGLSEMHISEGVLPAWEIVAGWGSTLPAVAYSIKRLSDEKLVLTALLTALFFVASLIHRKWSLETPYL